MAMKPVIDTEVLNALSGEPTSTTTQKIMSEVEDVKERVSRVEERLDNDQNQPKDEEKKKSFWNKVGGVIKKVASVVLGLLLFLPRALNSISRVKDKFGLRKGQLINAI